MKRLQGRVVLITGGAGGIGSAAARLFVAEGASVAIADVHEDEGRHLVDEIGERAFYLHLDVTDERQWASGVAAVVDRFGGLDGLVNNAGVRHAWAPLEEYSLCDYMRVIMVNQVGVFLGMRAVIPALERSNGGTIVNISSAAGMAGVAGTIAYGASKFAVRGMTKTAALELWSRGIRVNSVHPGGVDTPFIATVKRATASSERDAVGEAAQGRDRHFDPARLARPEEIANLLLFLSSDESSYSTGAEFLADGGQLAGFVFT